MALPPSQAGGPKSSTSIDRKHASLRCSYEDDGDGDDPFVSHKGPQMTSRVSSSSAWKKSKKGRSTASGGVGGSSRVDFDESFKTAASSSSVLKKSKVKGGSSKRGLGDSATRQNNNASSSSAAAGEDGLDSYEETQFLERGQSSNETSSEGDVSSDGGDIGEDRLCWRHDSSKVLSDWTIIVKRLERCDGSAGGEGGTTRVTSSEMYHVHKVFLAVGPRRSEAFSRMIRKSKTSPLSVVAGLVKRDDGADAAGTVESGGASNVSTVELEDTAADAFPYMLDYVYHGDLHVTTNRAVALRYLGTRFRIKGLHASSTDFVRSDLGPDTAPAYLLEAVKYDDERITKASADVCAEYFETIDHNLFYALTPALFLMILNSSKLQCESTLLSRTVFEFCERHDGEVDSDMLVTMTDEDIMPKVDAAVALPLLLLYIALLNEQEEFVDDHDTLKERCFNAAAEAWPEEVVDPILQDNGEEELNHRELPEPLKTEFLEVCLCTAKSDLDARDVELEKEESVDRVHVAEIDRLKGEMEALKESHAEEMKVLQAEVEALTSETLADANQIKFEKEAMDAFHHKETDDLHDKIRLLEAEVSLKSAKVDEYYGELRKFKRLPSIHKFGKVNALRGYVDKTTCTYSKHDDAKRRGHTPPHAFPAVADRKESGYVYQDEDGKLWPVYYFRGIGDQHGARSTSASIS